jgi:hypothetical protein
LKNQKTLIDGGLVLGGAYKGKVKGDIYFSYDNRRYHINVIGGFYLLQFLKLEYTNAKHATRQFGSFVLELSPDSTDMEGCFVGYGNRNKKVISGPVEFHKTPSL